MKTITIFASLLLACLILTNCTKKEIKPKTLTESKTDAQSVKMSNEDQVKRGKYLVEIALCNDCHTPKIMTDQGPIPDPKLLLSGHQSGEKLATIKDPNILKDYALGNMNFTSWIGPWGTSFAGNLTPDETGTGNWTYKNFERAIREGKFKGQSNGRELLPPMPWPNFKHFTDGDLQAIWAYLQSIPPVKNVVPAPIPPAS